MTTQSSHPDETPPALDPGRTVRDQAHTEAEVMEAQLASLDGLTVSLPEQTARVEGAVTAAEVVAGIAAVVGTAGAVAKAKIEARTEVRKAELEAQTRQLEITEETKRAEMRRRDGEAGASED